jgi:predicted GH43/DUF377 family glycosyl hydrolase
LGFGFVFAPAFAKATARHAVTGRCGHAPSLSLPKTPKFLAAERLRFFFKRSGRKSIFSSPGCKEFPYEAPDKEENCIFCARAQSVWQWRGDFTLHRPLWLNVIVDSPRKNKNSAMKFLKVFICVIVIVPAVVLQAQASESAGWVKYTNNPVLGGDYGTCFDISVLRGARARGETYRMWFSWRPKQSIALVESADGFHWSKPVIVLGPNKASGWEDDINRPTVIKKGGSYQMWYTGQANGYSAIGYATSDDGIVWKRASDQPVLAADRPWEKVAVMCPDVIWDGEFYRMWYSGGEQYEPDAIGYATSPDGMVWTKREDNPVFKADPGIAWEQGKVTACQVIKDGRWYLMFYIGFRDVNRAQIGLARSKDGITNWQRLPANPIIQPTPDGWDADACYKPYALFDGTQWLLWYNGRRGGAEQIGVATHEGRNLGF